MVDLKASPGKEPRLVVANGEVRAISHDGAEEAISSLVYRGQLSPEKDEPWRATCY